MRLCMSSHKTNITTAMTIADGVSKDLIQLLTLLKTLFAGHPVNIDNIILKEPTNIILNKYKCTRHKAK